MSFTPREKKLLIVAGIFVAAVLYFNFFFKPTYNRIRDLKDQIGVDERNYSMTDAYKVKIGKMESDLKILGQKVKNLRQEFPPVLNYDEVLIELRDMAKSAGTDIDSVTFSDITTADVAQAGSGTAANATNGGKASVSSVPMASITDPKLLETVKGMGMIPGNSTVSKPGIADGKGFTLSLKVTVNGTNSQIKSFVNNVENLKNRAVIKNIKIVNGSAGVLNANMTIDLYGIADSGAQNYSLFADGQWMPAQAAGKTDMFAPYKDFSGNIGSPEAGSTTAAGTVNQEMKYDFDITVLPYGNNLAPPTVSILCKSLVKSKEASLTPAIYGDNKDQEKADLVLEEKDGKFYCKYRTEQESFPDLSFKDAVEFKLQGDEIRLQIVSSARKFKGDNAALALNITNNSSKNLVVDVKYEDKSNPRVTINQLSSKIQVNY